MPRVDKLVITGEHREKIDAHAMARVIIRLARLWQRRGEEAEQPNSEEATP